MNKVLVVLDADVIIHFSKGDQLSLLPQIFQEYDYIVLDKVYQEIKGEIKNQLDNQINYLKNIQVLEYNPTGDEMKEFAMLSKNKGKGESACLSFCRFNHYVIGSSNLSDIQQYCKDFKITYLTTIDFLFFAIKKKLMTVNEAHEFIKNVTERDSKLPLINMVTYKSNVII
jgi:predicted nucleic acid-binding protein